MEKIMLFNVKQLTCFITLIMTSTLAISAQFPRGCNVQGYAFNTNFLILNDQGNQEFYLIHNSTHEPVILELHETEEAFMSPKLHSTIDPLRWSAFASDIKNQHFKCFTTDGDNTKVLDCGKVLEVCQYPRVKFALSNMGNYWVSSNKEQRLVIKDAIAKGIWLKW
jgi:hypothetical protein